MNESRPDNLDDDSLQFCTRCGSKVSGYRWNFSCGEADYGGYYDYYFEPVTEPSIEDTVYECRNCQTRWQAPGGDTGCVLPCGHFMPTYVAFCGACGQPTRTSG